MRRTLPCLLSLVLLAGACGGDDESSTSTTQASTEVTTDSQAPASSEDALERVRQASQRTVDAKSARLAFAIKLEPQSGQPIETKGDGIFAFGENLGQLTFDLSAFGPAAGGNIEAVFGGDTYYIKLPAASSPPGKPWLKFDRAALEGQGGDLSSLNQLLDRDPSRELGVVKGVTEAREIGTEELRGVDTTHYSAIIDLNKAATENPEIRDYVERLRTSAGVDQLPADVWLDDEGRLRRMSYRMDLSKLAASGGSTPGLAGTATADTELFDYGVDVQVQPPPADQVTDFRDVQGAGAGAGGAGAGAGSTTTSSP